MITETVVAFSQAVLRAGADGIFFATQSNASDFMESEQYAEFGRRHNGPVLEAIDGVSQFTMLHVCQKNIRFREFVDYPVHAINWDDRITAPSLKEARGLTDKCLIGGIDKEAVLWKGTPAQVEAQVKDAIESAGSRKLIIGPGCGIPASCPTENLAGLRRAVK